MTRLNIELLTQEAQGAARSGMELPPGVEQRYAMKSTACGEARNKRRGVLEGTSGETEQKLIDEAYEAFKQCRLDAKFYGNRLADSLANVEPEDRDQVLQQIVHKNRENIDKQLTDVYLTIEGGSLVGYSLHALKSKPIYQGWRARWNCFLSEQSEPALRPWFKPKFSKLNQSRLVDEFCRMKVYPYKPDYPYQLEDD